MSSYLIFIICSTISAFGTWLLVHSGGPTAREIAPYLTVIFGLGAIVLPILNELKE